MSAPEVTVVIPSYNGARYLGEAIESVLAQSHPSVETIVVDDGSVDETGSLVASYGDRIRCVRQENRGLAAARNSGVRAAGGAYVAFLDHDDRYLPEKIARQVAVFRERPEVGLVHTGWHFIDELGRRLGQRGWSPAEGDVLEPLLLGNLVHPGAVMVRRDRLLEVGGFDEARTGLEDWDLWLRLSVRGLRWGRVDAALLEYRVHPGQMHKHGPARRLSNQLATLGRLFADPGLPASVRALEPHAYQNVHLRAAADYYRGGACADAGRAFHAAVRVRPAVLTESRSLRAFCRLLAPTGFQRQDLLAADWRRVGRTLRAMVGDVLALPGLEPDIFALRWRARLTALRVTAHLFSRRLLGVAGLRRAAS
jgi:hypothetical protein